jgi:hypothetical protein
LAVAGLDCCKICNKRVCRPRNRQQHMDGRGAEVAGSAVSLLEIYNVGSRLAGETALGTASTTLAACGRLADSVVSLF